MIVARLMTDLCASCQKNSVNLSEEEKSEINHHYKKSQCLTIAISFIRL